jgi:hypothetical protein
MRSCEPPLSSFKVSKRGFQPYGYGSPVEEKTGDRWSRRRYSIRGIKLNGITGYLVRSVEDAAQRALQLLADPDLRCQPGENGHLHVKQNFVLTPARQGLHAAHDRVGLPGRRYCAIGLGIRSAAQKPRCFFWPENIDEHTGTNLEPHELCESRDDSKMPQKVLLVFVLNRGGV